MSRAKGNTLSFFHDTLNRRCSKAIATTATACSATSSSNPTVWYDYDLDNRLVAANDNSATLAAPASAASYDTAITYDALNHPLDVSWNPATAQATPSAASVTFQLAYDGNNRRITQTATNSSWWSYPAATASSLTYNTNALNQYTCIFASTCSATLTYDGDGNLTYDGTFTYAYDAENRLTTILNGMTTVATYAYDSMGRRKSKTVGATTTDYVTDADNREVLEYNGSSGALQNWYAYGLGSNAVLNQMNVASSTRETMVPDVQGSVIASLDAVSGSLSNTGYQTFGENPSLTSGTFNYTAQRFDPETAGSASQPSGLYYYRARMYSPTIGRFLQADPTGYQAGMNLYAYTNNDPLDNTDPLGLWLVQIGLGASGKGFWSGGGEWGIAFGTGGIGVYTTGSYGTFSGVGEEGALQAALTFTPSGSVSELTGAAANSSISGGELATVGVNYSVAPNGESSYGISAGIGGGTDFQASETVQGTVGVCLLFCSEPSTAEQQPQQQLTPSVIVTEIPVPTNPDVEPAQPDGENDVNGVNFGNTDYFSVPQLSLPSSSQPLK